jgi:hypothetical protein
MENNTFEMIDEEKRDIEKEIDELYARIRNVHNRVHRDHHHFNNKFFKIFRILNNENVDEKVTTTKKELLAEIHQVNRMTVHYIHASVFFGCAILFIIERCISILLLNF